MNFIVAVPALVNCADPSRWMSSQYVAVASQKLTRPVVNAFAPALTEAVIVTALPAATVVTGLPTEVSARVVVVVAGAARTITTIGWFTTIRPDVPVMVAVVLPARAELLAVSVSTLLAVVGFGENAAVTPLGRPAIVSPTEAVKPYCGTTPMVDVAELPANSINTLGASDSVNVDALTVKPMEVVAVALPEVPVMVTVY
jgi:hypothetical protein